MIEDRKSKAIVLLLILLMAQQIWIQGDSGWFLPAVIGCGVLFAIFFINLEWMKKRAEGTGQYLHGLVEMVRNIRTQMQDIRKWHENAMPEFPAPKPKPQPAPTGAQRKAKAMYRSLSTGSVVRRFLLILVSGCLCAGVGYYMYNLIWEGQHLPNFGMSSAWFPWHGELHEIHPTVYAMALLAVYLHFERASAHANPGYGLLWHLDFWPSFALAAFFVVTFFVAVIGRRFADPTHLWILFIFLGSAISVAYYNFLRIFESDRRDNDILLAQDQIAEAIQKATGHYSINLYPRPGYHLDPERAYVPLNEPVRLRQATAS